LIEEEVVGVKITNNERDNSKPNILSKDSMGFKEPSEFAENWSHHVLFGKLVDGKTEYHTMYNDRTLIPKPTF